MPVVAMTVAEKNPHPQTENLFIYRFESANLGSKTIVANLTNVYEVGQVAAIAQLGTLLPEGEIKPRKVFGVDSEGMALGPVQAAPDTDLSSDFDADAPQRSWTLTFEIEVEAHYAGDAEKAARKMFKSGAGTCTKAV